MRPGFFAFFIWLSICASLSETARAEVIAEGTEPFPGYRVSRFLGRGGFGEVWEATNPEGKKVALKFVKVGPQSATEIGGHQMMAQIKPHPNIVTYDKIWPWRQYVVMMSDLADGTLADALEIYRKEFHEKMPAKEVAGLLLQVAEALDYLNTRQHRVNAELVGIQHADAKPGNMLIFGDTIRLGDFGLATTMKEASKPTDFRGTTEYAAPEIWKGRLSQNTDQYALAVSYAWLRMGVSPFPSIPPDFQPGYVRPPPRLAEMTREEQAILLRALHTIPEMRYSSCKEMMRDLWSAAPE